MAAYIYITMSESGVSITNNTSVVSVNVYYVGNGKSWSNNYCSGTINIGGQSFSFSHQFARSTSAQWIGGASATIAHNSSGGGSVSASASFATGVSIGTLTASNSMTLQTIPRASVASVGNSHPHYGDTVRITISPQMSGATHKLYVGADEHLSWTKIADNVSTSYDWTIPMWIAEHYTTKENALWLNVETYLNGSYIGSRQYKPAFYLEPTDEMLPELSVLVTDPTGLLDTYSGYVKSLSKIRVETVEVPYKGSQIVSRKIIANGESFTTKNAETNTVNGETLIAVECTDARGMTKRVEKTIPIIDWQTPKIEQFNVVRCGNDGIPSSDGANAKVSYMVKVASLNGQNQIDFTLHYKERTATGWTSRKIEINEFIEGGFIIIPCNKYSTFDFKLSLKDKLSQVESKVVQLSTAFELINFHESGTGIGIGKAAEEENLIDIAIPIRFVARVRGISEILIFQDINISAGNVVADTTHREYPYRVDIPLQGCTVEHLPDVYPKVEDAGKIYPRCKTQNGYLRIWVKNNTFETITIPSIKLSKGV